MFISRCPFFRFKRNREEVEDLVQDIFLKVYQNLHSYDDRYEFSSWIWSIARDKSYEKIGKILGKLMNTVGTLIRRAKNKMLAQIDNVSGQMTTLEARYL